MYVLEPDYYHSFPRGETADPPAFVEEEEVQELHLLGPDGRPIEITYSKPPVGFLSKAKRKYYFDED